MIAWFVEFVLHEAQRSIWMVRSRPRIRASMSSVVVVGGEAGARRGLGAEALHQGGSNGGPAPECHAFELVRELADIVGVDAVSTRRRRRPGAPACLPGDDADAGEGGEPSRRREVSRSSCSAMLRQSRPASHPAAAAMASTGRWAGCPLEAVRGCCEGRALEADPAESSRRRRERGRGRTPEARAAQSTPAPVEPNILWPEKA
jgi:hypothetical protein